MGERGEALTFGPFRSVTADESADPVVVELGERQGAAEMSAVTVVAGLDLRVEPFPDDPDPVPGSSGRAPRRWVAYRDGQRASDDTAAVGRVAHRRAKDRHAARSTLRTAARRAGLWVNPRVSGCGLSGGRPDGSVTVRYTRAVGADGPVVGVSGLMACGNGWLCPVCAAKVAARRAKVLAAALEHAVSTGGWAVLVTLTIRHGAEHSLADGVRAIRSGWSRVRSKGKGWAEDRADFGIVGCVRAVEITAGPNGWHPHVHAVVVFDRRPSSVEIDRLAGRLFDRWTAGVTAAGMPAPIADAGGLDVSHLGEHARPEQLTASLEAWSRYAVKGITGETVLGVVKDANGANRSILQLMADALVGVELVADDGAPSVRMTDERAVDLLREYERETKGIKQLTGLKELQDALGLEVDESSDEEVVAEEAGGEDVAVIAGGYWDDLVEPRMAELVAYGIAWGPDGIRRLLTSWGVPWTMPEHREDGTRAGRSWQDVREDQERETARDLAAVGIAEGTP